MILILQSIAVELQTVQTNSYKKRLHKAYKEYNSQNYRKNSTITKIFKEKYLIKSWKNILL